MAKRLMKTTFMLAIVLCLIYMRQLPAAYAGEPKDSTEQTGREEQAAGPEESEGSDRGNGEEGAEGEDGDGKEGEGRDDTEEEGGKGTEGEDGGDTGEEEKPDKPIVEYELKIPEADGENGYYLKKPRIEICHVSETGVTKYVLSNRNGVRQEKTLAEKNERAVMEEKDFAEGKNILHVWMEDDSGKKIEKYELEKEFRIDTQAPEAKLNIPGETGSWHSGRADVGVEAADDVSGVRSITAYAAGKKLGSSDQSKAEFTIEQASSAGEGVPVTVFVKDKAGNQSRSTCSVYIDRKSPVVSVTGAENYEITGKPKTLVCTVEEENVLKELSVRVMREDETGEKRELQLPDWRGDGAEKQVSFRAEEDGIYQIAVHAQDMSGHVSEKAMQMILDSKSPVIRYVDGLQGRYLQKFCWEYPEEEMIQDLTSYTCDVRLDGKLYRNGKTVLEEGRHRLTVDVKDAAGNRARAGAEFVIDHTGPEIVFRGIQEGEEYEKECTFKVGAAGAQDTVREIQINGEKQKIDPGRKTYEYTLQSCQDYEVTATAADRAGNISKRSVYFSIVQEETLADRIRKPIQSYFRGIGEGGNDQKAVPEKKQKNQGERGMAAQILKTAGCGLLGLLVVLGGILLWRKESPKREDAG